MKKICMLLTLVIALFAMASCNGNSPSGTATKALNAAKAKDFNTVVDLMGDKNGDALNAEVSEQLKSMLTEKVGKNRTEKIEGFKIDKEQISDDGNKAVVYYTITYEGKGPKNEKMDLVKGSDGQWRVAMSK